jgi:hypothetical protein
MIKSSGDTLRRRRTLYLFSNKELVGFLDSKLYEIVINLAL